MPEITSDIIVSTATLYYAPIGTTLPADNLAAGAAWPTGWVKVGFTKEPLKFNYDYETLDVDIQESLAPIESRKTSESLMLETVMAEFSIPTVNLMFDGAVTTQASGPGYEKLALGGSWALTKRLWGFEGSYYDEDNALFPFRLFVWRGVASGGGDMEFGKADYVGVPLKIKGLADMARAVGARLFQFVRITEA